MMCGHSFWQSRAGAFLVEAALLGAELGVFLRCRPSFRFAGCSVPGPTGSREIGVAGGGGGKGAAPGHEPTQVLSGGQLRAGNPHPF